MSTLSIIIPSANERDLWHTVKSIRDTAGYAPEIVIVDDLSATPLTPHPNYERNLIVVNNQNRIGVGPSRHIGALRANGDILLFVDAHMRFTPGWFENLMRRAEGRPHTLHCGMCIALDDTHLDPMAPGLGQYCGATWNMNGTDPRTTGKWQILEPVWYPSPLEDDAELPAVMGAIYAMPRKWFLELSPLAHIRGWGEDETFLSITAWCSGGDIRFMREVRVGHVFAGPRRPQIPNHIDPKWPSYNKYLAIATLLPASLTLRYLEEFRKHTPDAIREKLVPLVEATAHIMCEDIVRYDRLFKRDMFWLCSKFGIPIP